MAGGRHGTGWQADMAALPGLALERGASTEYFACNATSSFCSAWRRRLAAIRAIRAKRAELEPEVKEVSHPQRRQEEGSTLNSPPQSFRSRTC